MNNYYAQLDDNNIVFSLIESNLKESEKIIQISNYNTDLLSNKYVNGKFIKANFSHDNNFKVNQKTLITVNFVAFDFSQGKHITDTSINKTVEVDIDGNKFSLPIVNGEGLIELTSPNAGKHIITVDNYRCEVIVNEG